MNLTTRVAELIVSLAKSYFFDAKEIIDMLTLEDLFYKKRYIYICHRDDYKRREKEHDKYEVKIDSGVITEPSSELDQHYRRLCSEIGKAKVDVRLNHPDCTLIRAISKEDGQLAGFEWNVNPTEEVIWYDKYPVRPGEPLLFNVKVFEEHRRQGLHTVMHLKHVNYIFDNLSDKCVIITEASNEPMVNALRKYGWSWDKMNCLYKLFGVSVFSKIEDKDETELHFIPAKETLI